MTIILSLKEKVEDFSSNYKVLFPVVGFIPILIGGSLQFFELASISPSFLRFFSVTQLISDGIGWFVFLAFITLVSSFFYQAFQKVRNDSSREVFKSEIFPLSILMFILMVILFFIKGSYPLDDIVNWSNFFSYKYTSWSEFFLGFFVILLSLFIASVIVVGIIDYLILKLNIFFRKGNKDVALKIFRKVYFYILYPSTAFLSFLTIYIVLVSLSKLMVMKNEFLQSEQFLNSKELIQDQKEQYPNQNIKIEYFNDRYVFVRIGQNIKVLKNESFIK